MAFEMAPQGRILYLPIRLVHASPSPRSRETVQLQELAGSIRQVGILQPLTVRSCGDRFSVVSGARRLMAARMAGLSEVPCILLDADAASSTLIFLTENLQREDLHYFDEAECLQKYLMESGLTQAQAAARLGRSQSAVANKLRLLSLGPKLQQLLRERGLSERHARALLRLPGESQRLLILEEVIARGLTAAQTEQYIKVYLQNRATPGEKFHQRDARLFLGRVAREAEPLRRQGVAELQTREEAGAMVLTLRVGPSEDR